MYIYIYVYIYIYIYIEREREREKSFKLKVVIIMYFSKDGVKMSDNCQIEILIISPITFNLLLPFPLPPHQCSLPGICLSLVLGHQEVPLEPEQQGRELSVVSYMS
jgi:hypothetical protein